MPRKFADLDPQQPGLPRHHPSHHDSVPQTWIAPRTAPAHPEMHTMHAHAVENLPLVTLAAGPALGAPPHWAPCDPDPWPA
ncbi:hypothetical protein GCM10023201_23600 [Actinomycetospora corticicola]